MTDTLEPQNSSTPGTAPVAPATTNSAPTPRPKPWKLGLALAGALAVGLLAGIGIMAAANDPTSSVQYRALQSSYAAASAGASIARNDAAQMSSRAESAQAAATAALGEAQSSEQAVAEQQAAASATLASLSAQVQVVQQNTIGEGTWTVGSDVQPGRYRTTAPVSQGCYWEITRTGTNGSSIIQNDLPTGGYPTVSLSVGQDFKTEGCGSWLKQ